MLNLFTEILVSGVNVWNMQVIFFRMCVLPELMGSWFTYPLASEDLTEERIPSVNTPTESEVVQPSDIHLDDQPDTTYCYYHGPESGSMLACDNKDCPIEWFHLDTFNLKPVVNYC